MLLDWKRSLAKWIWIVKRNWLIALAVLGLALILTCESIEWLIKVVPGPWRNISLARVPVFLVLSGILFPTFLAKASRIGRDRIRYRRR